MKTALFKSGFFNVNVKFEAMNIKEKYEEILFGYVGIHDRDELIEELLNLHSVVGSAKQLEGFGEDLTRVYYVKCSECGCEHNDNGNDYCCGCGRKFE